MVANKLSPTDEVAQFDAIVEYIKQGGSISAAYNFHSGGRMYIGMATGRYELLGMYSPEQAEILLGDYMMNEVKKHLN